jgi:putative ABC transport system permease protein
VLSIVFVVVALGIANTILMSVLERTREFGVMMALGTQRGDIARVVLYEALLLALVGIVLGLAVGGGVVAYLGHRGINHSQYSQAMQTMPGLTGMVYPTISAMQLVWLSLLVLGTTVAASIYPAFKATRLTPIGAIRGARQIVAGKWRILRQTVAAIPVRAIFARIALQGLARNPRRAVLTLGALGAGLAAFLFLSALAEGLYLQMRTNATDLLTGHLQVEVKGFRDDLDPKLTLAGTDALLARLRRALPAATMTPRMQTQAMVSSTTQSEPVVVYGVDPMSETTVTRLDRQLSEGSYLRPNSKREIVIGTKLAERLRVRLGEKIVMMTPSADGSLGSAALRVAGIYVTGNDRLDRSMTFVSLATARELLGVPQEASTIVLHLPNIENVDQAAAILVNELTAPGQQIVTWKTLLPEVVQMLDLLRIMLRIILIVVFGVVALGVANTLLMAVLERTREFGLQLALGTRPIQIVRTVLYESLLLGILGLGLGAIVGGLIVAYYHAFGFDLSDYAAGIASVPGMSTVVYPTLVFGNVWLPVVALFISSIMAALYPAWRAARLDPVQALKHV